MVPTDTGIQLQQVFLLVVEVETCHLRSRQTLSATSEATASATREAHVIHIIGTQRNEDLQIRTLHTRKDSSTITMSCTCRQISIQHESLVHTPFDTEVEYGFLLTVINTTDTGEVTLLVVSLHPLHDRGGQVLHSGLGITSHKLLTINQDFLHLLTIDRHFTVIINLCTRQFTYQFLDDRALGGTIGRGVIYKGILFHCHLGCLSCYCCSFQHDRIGLEVNRSQGDILVG